MHTGSRRPCSLASEASADCPHNFRALLHWVLLSDTDLDCIWFKTGLDTVVQNKFWQTYCTGKVTC